MDFELGGQVWAVFRLNLGVGLLYIAVKLMDRSAMHFLPVIVTVLNGNSVIALVWFWQGAFLLLRNLFLGLGRYFKRAMWVPLGLDTVTLSDCLVHMPGFAKVALLLWSLSDWEWEKRSTNNCRQLCNLNFKNHPITVMWLSKGLMADDVSGIYAFLCHIDSSHTSYCVHFM